MAKRTVALCEGKYIGIETIYTIINGQQINIPEKLNDLRKKSQSNQLFCPCGCGANLTLVAGDRNLREQHFRMKDDANSQKCSMITEGKTSVNSKIVLKCWLDEKLASDDIESRVSINDIADTDRKYEYTFLSKRKAVAISYAHERVNLSDEKLNILEANSQGIKIIYIVDFMNAGTNGQFPEALMKIQNRQGYCLLLRIAGTDYYKADMRAVYYDQDIDGFWEEIELTEGTLSNYSIDSVGCVIFNGQKLDTLLEKSTFENNVRLEKMRRQRAVEERQRREFFEKIQEEERDQYIARQKQQEQERVEAELRYAEEKKREEEFKRAIECGELRQDEPLRDAAGKRWVKCEFCGEFKTENEFSSYGGQGRVNLGTCSDCEKNNPEVKKRFEEAITVKKKYDPNKCPECADGVLKEKNGRFGRFMGCSNFPRCRYTRRMR